MAIQMTRAEYEAKYGQAPAASSIDTTPAPIRMTRAEYNAKYRPELSQPTEPVSFPVTPWSLMNRIGDNFFSKEGMGDIKETFQSSIGIGQEQLERQSGIRERMQTGEVGQAEGRFQQFGMAAKGAGDFLFNAGLGLVKSTMSESTEQRTGNFFSNWAGAVGQRAQEDLQSYRTSEDPLDQQFAEGVDDFAQKYKEDPVFRDTVDASLGIFDAVTTVLGGKVAKEVVEEGVEGAGAALRSTDFSSVTKPIDDAIDRAARAVAPDLETKRADAILSVETRYGPTRRANEFEADNGAASRARIARTNVLEGAVDTDGKISTREKGGAVEQYRKLTIEGAEDVVRKNLEREGKSVSLQEVRNLLIGEVYRSGLEGADLVRALKGVEREIEGLSLRADGLQMLPLHYVQDAKISTTRNINFQTPPETATYRKAVARGYKNLIERKSDLNVAEINQELSKYYKDIERLERLDGKVVKGGRLGKYFAQTTGTMVGGAAGTVAGGPGAAIGGMIGGEIAQRLQGRAMSRTFGKGGADVVSNPVLDAARRNANLPPGRDLTKPDQAVGAPAGVTKTKEVASLEKQIKKNVTEQKAAIKKQDWDLVAALKKVYDALLEQLNDTVRFIKENVGDNKGAINPNRVKLKDSDKEATLDALMAYDETPVTTNNPTKTTTSGQLSSFDMDDADIRLAELKDKNAKKILTNAEIAEAKELLEQKGALGKTKAATPETTNLLEEARKYKSAEEFVKSKVQETNGYKHFDPDQYNNLEEFIRDSEKVETRPYEGTAKDQARVKTLIEVWGDRPDEYKPEKIDVSKIRFVEPELANKPKAGRKIETPIEVSQTKGGYDLIDGRHRIDQAVANGETEIEAVVRQKSYLTQLEDIWKQANGGGATSNLLEEARKYPDAESFKNSFLRHGTNADIVDGKLTTKGKQGTWDSGGIFLTDEKQISQVFGDKQWRATVADMDILDLTKKEGVDEVRSKIGTTYTDYDGEVVPFTQQDFDMVFVDGKADFATIAQYPEFFEQLGFDGLKYKEFAGGVEGNTYQLYKDEIPIFSDAELEKIWREANQ